MKTIIKNKVKNIKTLRSLKRSFDKIFTKFIKFSNGLGKKRKCYICGKTFNYFTKYRGGKKKTNEFRLKLNGVGSDIDNYGCMYCGCNDRERHLFMFFDKINFWEIIKNRKILHFAPEKQLQIRISEQQPYEYIKADLYPKNPDVRKIDAIAIPLEDNSFDILIANHILEHIPNYHKAIAEFYRVIKPGGIAIFQTPFSNLLRNNFEDEGINNDELRLIFYGQEDHVRIFGERQFFRSLEDAGFILQIKNHEDYFNDSTTFYYGVNKKEDLIFVVKQVKR